MAIKDLFHYFKRYGQTSLLKNTSQYTIDAVHREITKICSQLQSDGSSKESRQVYQLTAKDRATIGEYAAKNGIAAAIRHFKQNSNFPNFKDTSVCG